MPHLFEVDPMERSRVAVLKTTPATVISDYSRLMRLANYQQYLPRQNETALKINISWHYFYPACSTTPWQLDGVISTLKTGIAKKSCMAVTTARLWSAPGAAS